MPLWVGMQHALLTLQQSVQPWLNAHVLQSEQQRALALGVVPVAPPRDLHRHARAQILAVTSYSMDLSRSVPLLLVRSARFDELDRWAIIHVSVVVWRWPSRLGLTPHAIRHPSKP